MGGIIADNEMQVEIGGCPFVDGVEEAEELAMTAPGHAFADDGAVEHVENREQGGAVALVSYTLWQRAIANAPLAATRPGLSLARK